MSESRAPLRVVAGILRDDLGRVLLAQRPPGSDQEGLWEFPGGKVEPGESDQEALVRELDEELGIAVGASAPFRRVLWHRPGRSLELIGVEVSAFQGDPVGRHGQALRWLPPGELLGVAMPDADRPIAVALVLPRHYAITPEPGPDRDAFLAALDRTLAAGIRLVQLRARTVPRVELARLARASLEVTRRHGARMLLNGDVRLADELGCDGVHLRAEQLRELTSRPLPSSSLVGASCHGPQELARAQALGADFVTLSPVAPTGSHPGHPALGWQAYADATSEVALPSFALGGLGRDMLAVAVRNGAHGVAGISGFWASS